MRPHALRDTELADNIELRGIGIHQSYSPPTLVIAIQHAIGGDRYEPLPLPPVHVVS
mgnify:CR=1 FL=1